MVGTIILSTLIIGYSVFILRKSFKRKSKGDCCSNNTEDVN